MRRGERGPERAGRSARLGAVTLAFAGLAPALLAGCEAPPRARAFRATDRVQLVGGPSAIGEPGDFVLENDVIRTVVLAQGNSGGPGLFGGTLVDADLQRPEASHSAGRGYDQFAELFPMANLVIPGYEDGGDPGMGDLAVEVWSDGTDGRCPLGEDEAPEGCAAIRVAGQGDRIIEALGTVALLQVPMDLSFVTYYVLRPGDRFVRLRTFFWDNQQWTMPRDLAASAEEPAELARLAAGSGLEPISEPQPIFESLVGDALAETPPDCGGEPCYRHPGYLAGDFLMLGGRLGPFGTSSLASGEGADRSGFEIPFLFQRRYDRDEVVLATPLADDVILGAGDRVSYGYMSAAGNVVVPIFTGTFTGAFTHSFQCVTTERGVGCGDALRRPLQYDRYFVVGEGDAASVLDVYYDLRGLSTGRLRGHVLDEVTGQPVPGARVFALLDPRLRPDGTVDETVDLSTYAAASAAIRGRFGGNAGIVSFAAVDRGVDRVPDASWSMRLEPGRYLLVAHLEGREPGAPVPVEVRAGAERTLSLALPPTGRLHFEVVDDRGEHVASKLTLIGPLDEDAECPSDLPIPEMSSLRHVELGSSERPHGIARVLYSRSGQGTVELAPGRYDAIASRGFEYSIDRRCVTVRHDTAPIEAFSVLREVDTTGWVAGDFHVHGVNSYDGNMPHDVRVVSAVAEGLEVFATTDHDYITNLEPVVFDLGMRDEISTVVGIEVTPIETGHLLGYPLRFDETAVDNGAVDWSRRDLCLAEPEGFGCQESGTGSMALTPQVMFDALRSLGEFGPDHTVVTVPHPRDGFFGYFDQFHLNQFDLGLEPAGLVAGQNPLLADYTAPGNVRIRLYSERFDAVELFNGRRYEYIRTPTVGEVNDFVADLAEVRASAAGDEEYARRMTAAHDASMRRVLVRTAEEQALMRMSERPGCLDHDDCEEGEVCDPHRATCVPEMPRCELDDDCTEACVERPRCETSGTRCAGDADCGPGESCLPVSECATLATPCAGPADCRLACEDGLCEPAPLPCTADADCPGRWEYRCEGTPGTCRPAFPSCSARTLICPRGTYCESGVRPGQQGGRCLEECETDLDCRPDEYCFGEPGAGRFCRTAGCNIGPDGLPDLEQREGTDRPCVRFGDPHSEGVVDDWFRLLNYGVAYTAMGNSDTHNPSSEIGLPRNFVMSSADAPAMISRLEIADAIRDFRVVASYGPFVEVSAEGGIIGDTVSADGPVELRVRVQSASWFDVDRIEVYANGELLCDLGHGSTDPSRCATDAEMAVGPDGRNTDIVNFDGVVVDDPAVDTWYVVIAMGVSEQARGLAPVYFPSMHPELGFSEVIGQAFASFDVDLLSAVVPPPVQRAQINEMIPYAVTNPIWVESRHDDDEVFTAPLGLPPYRRDIPCQFALEPVGCREVDVFPLSSASLGRSPLVADPEDPETRRARRVMMMLRALTRLAAGGD